MVLVKILGAIDIIAALVFLVLIFGVQPLLIIILFAAILLFVKGLFALTGDVLSFFDLIASIILFFTIPFHLPVIFLWIPTFILLAKGFVSFL